MAEDNRGTRCWRGAPSRSREVRKRWDEGEAAQEDDCAPRIDWGRHASRGGPRPPGRW